jgi:hypothetical protein
VIIRSARPRDNFTIISNQVIRDHRLTWKARGLLIYVLSQPDHWRTSSSHLASISPDGVYAIRTGLDELEQLGYLERRRYQTPNGQWRHDIIIHDQPVDNPVNNPVTYSLTDYQLPDVG